MPQAMHTEAATEQQLHFARIAEEVMRLPWGTARTDEGAHTGIGTLGEKRLHAIIKRYLCEDITAHEQLVGDMAVTTDEGGQVVGKKRRMIADILTPDGQIFEVQTGGLFPLQKKIAWYLSHTPYRVTVVYPIAAVKYLSRIDPTDGQIISRRKSPKRGKIEHIAKELYWISEFIGDPRFSLRVLLLEMDEYRLNDGRDRRGRPCTTRYERIPIALLEDVTLATPEHYAALFLPDSLPTDEPFTAAVYARATGLKGKTIYGILYLLCRLGLLEQTEKIGRSKGFRRCPAPDASGAENPA